MSRNDIVPLIPDERPESVAASLFAPKDYNHDIVNVPEAWKSTKGRGAKVAILDTGMPRHKDIDVIGSRSFVDGYLEDANGHATAVGGILCGTGGPGGSHGVTGIAPEADDYYGAVLNASGAGALHTVADGVRWAIDEIGADVINLSLGTAGRYGCDESLVDACQYAYDNGAVVVAAAGNDASDVNWPAALDTVIAVAAVDRSLKPASFSARGPEVEFAAGGVSVATSYTGNGYACLSGTSFSAPVISGMAALVISAAKLKGEDMSPESVRAMLKSMSYDIGGDGKDDLTGWGIPVFTKDCSGNVVKKDPWLSRLWSRIRWWLSWHM